jgi:hypothetical protein
MPLAARLINTKRVTDRRKLRFENVEAALRDAESMGEAERLGTLRATGNWTLGQALGHLACWASYPYDGYPDMPTPPALVRLLLRPMRWWFFNRGLPAGVSLPDVPGGTFGVDVLPSEEGLAKMRLAFERLARHAPTCIHPIFPGMKHEDWLKLNLRHAELHLSFFHAS